MASEPQTQPAGENTSNSLVRRLWSKIVDQWVIGGVLAGVVGLVLVVYGLLRNDLQHTLNRFIDTAVSASLNDPSTELRKTLDASLSASLNDPKTELHKTLSKLIIGTVQGTVGASTKQFFELSGDQSVQYVPIYIPKDHDLLIFVDFVSVPKFQMPEKLVFSLEGLAEEISTNEPRSFAPIKILQKVRQQREEATTEAAFAGPKEFVGILGRIAPNVFTAQFQLRQTDSDKRIFVKLIVLV
jgi:hypothetical protein